MGNSVLFAAWFTCSTQRSSAALVASMLSRSRLRRDSRQSQIHSTWCSMPTIMLTSTEGLPAPVMMNRFGKPLIMRPR